MTEEYRIIEKYENYSVSNLGDVKNNKTGRILKPCTVAGDYYQVGLRCTSTGIRRNFLNHRLVATAFILPVNGNQKWIILIVKQKIIMY